MILRKHIYKSNKIKQTSRGNIIIKKK